MLFHGPVRKSHHHPSCRSCMARTDEYAVHSRTCPKYTVAVAVDSSHRTRGWECEWVSDSAWLFLRRAFRESTAVACLVRAVREFPFACRHICYFGSVVVNASPGWLMRVYHERGRLGFCIVLTYSLFQHCLPSWVQPYQLSNCPTAAFFVVYSTRFAPHSTDFPYRRFHGRGCARVAIQRLSFSLSQHQQYHL